MTLLATFVELFINVAGNYLSVFVIMDIHPDDQITVAMLAQRVDRTVFEQSTIDQIAAFHQDRLKNTGYRGGGPDGRYQWAFVEQHRGAGFQVDRRDGERDFAVLKGEIGKKFVE